ncbi:unnamed protein product [Soboliphyme baturini]|uniref:Transposase n=1 Tax=Soboliphyme baturini TaxID=241478 RepID=A0A183IDH9_9BILA|nr:unnamed protein product [Soboliphyme baturini]
MTTATGQANLGVGDSVAIRARARAMHAKLIACNIRYSHRNLFVCLWPMLFWSTVGKSVIVLFIIGATRRR